jgi:hypothetical protein
MRITANAKSSEGTSANKMSALRNHLTTLIVAPIASVVLVSHAFAQTPTAVERSKQMKIKIGRFDDLWFQDPGNFLQNISYLIQLHTPREYQGYDWAFCGGWLRKRNGRV